MFNKNIVLVGPMGAGKSTIGRMLAKELGLEFIDSDREIEQRCGTDIPWIFDKEGESGFRDREQKVLSDLCEGSNRVIATGGGAVMRDDNREVIAKNATVIYLNVSVSQQLERTKRDRNRPLLQKGNAKATLSKLFEERHPLYEALADIELKTDKKRPKTVIKTLVQRLDELNSDRV